jgi:hypothetical protein
MSLLHGSQPPYPIAARRCLRSSVVPRAEPPCRHLSQGLVRVRRERSRFVRSSSSTRTVGLCACMWYGLECLLRCCILVVFCKQNTRKAHVAVVLKKRIPSRCTYTTPSNGTFAPVYRGTKHDWTMSQRQSCHPKRKEHAPRALVLHLTPMDDNRVSA